MARISTAVLALFATTQAAVAEKTVWDVSLWGQRRAFTEHVEKIAEFVEARTRGEFVLNISYGGLSPNRENLDGISQGLFQMAQFCAGYHRDKNPTITVLELPFIGIESLEEELAVSLEVYKHPAVQQDLARWNAMLFMPTPLPQYNLVGRGAAPVKLSDFEGMRVRATGGIGRAFSTVGSEAVALTATETFDAMESGDLDAVAFAQHGHFSFKTIDLAEWWTDNLNPGSVNCPVVVNKQAYEALSSEHREALDLAVGVALEHYLDYYNDLISKWDEVLALFEVEKVALPEQEIASFRAQAADSIREAWIAEMNEQGLPGEELFELVATSRDNFKSGSLPLRFAPDEDLPLILDVAD